MSDGDDDDEDDDDDNSGSEGDGVAAQPGVASIVATSSSTASVSDLELGMSSTRNFQFVPECPGEYTGGVGY
jgi:hypothetical protein